MYIKQFCFSSVLLAAATLAQAQTSSPFHVLPTPSGGYDSFLFAASASSPKDIWAVGETAIHFDGTAWTDVPVPGIEANNTASLQGVATVSSNDAWAVGNMLIQHGQIIEHWNGTEWNQVAGPTFSSAANLPVWSRRAVCKRCMGRGQPGGPFVGRGL